MPESGRSPVGSGSEVLSPMRMISISGSAATAAACGCLAHSACVRAMPPAPLNAVINIPEEFKNDFRVITMDQRNAAGGELTGSVPVDDPWGAFAADQLGLMDHLGIRQFFFFGNCIGGPFAMKLMERAPQRVVAAL